MNLEQAIKTALEFENKVRDTYEEARVKATDPLGRRIFSVLAEEEQSHIAYLNHCYESWKQDGKLTAKKLATTIPSADRIQQGLQEMKEKVKDTKEASSAEVDLLQRAIEAEEQTSSFYKKMVSELDEQGQQLFARFVEIEEGHLAIVRAEMDSVTGLGYWFDMPEWQFRE
jgi:rubrerythrin